MRPPIIIGSAPSSGSTLLRVILGRHPSIAPGGEVALLDKRGLLRESPRAYRVSVRHWLDVGYPAEFLGPSEELFEELDEYPWDRGSLRSMCLASPDYPAMLQSFYSQNVDYRGARRWLDKSPSNIYCFDLIATLYAGARFIHIVRDARDTVISYSRRTASAFRAVARWYFANLSGLQYAAWPNYLRIRYEDLVRDPKPVLRRIYDFLEEPYMESLIIPDENVPTQPRHSSWRYSERGTVQSGSIGQHAALTEEQRSMFAHVRLSAYGLALLSEASPAPRTLSPVELQQVLGYDTDDLKDLPTLNPDQLRQNWQDFVQYRWQIYFRHGVTLECAVALSGMPESEA